MTVREKFISISEVARRMGISRPTATARLVRGTIPGYVRHFGLPRVQREVFEKWLEKQGSVKTVKVV